jgi:hypothetical protein
MAQVTTNLTDPTYIAVNSTVTAGSGIGGPNGYFLTTGQGLPLGYFATQSSVNVLSSRLDSAFAAFDPTKINAQFAAFNDRIGIATEVATIAASMRDAIPNPGDRFAIRLNAAAMDGYAAGSFGIGLALTDSARLAVTYGRGRTQNVVSGGVNISFH